MTPLTLRPRWTFRLVFTFGAIEILLITFGFQIANLLEGLPIITIISGTYATLQFFLGIFFIRRAREFVLPVSTIEGHL